MGLTPTYSLPYPEETDQADVPVDVYELAARLDIVLASKSDLTALGAYVPLTQKGVANGVAQLDSGGKVPTAQLPGALVVIAPTHLSCGSPSLNAVVVANQAYLVPLPGVVTPTSVSRIAFGLQAVVAGNYDVGLYYSDDDATFTRLASKGSAAQPVAGNILAALGAAATLTPVVGRRWYVGIALSTASSISMMGVAGQAHGIVAFTKAASFPLPASLVGMTVMASTPVPALQVLV